VAAFKPSRLLPRLSLRVVDWFRDRALRKVMKYGLPVAIGKFAASVSNLIALALLSRHLGPGPLGAIAVIRTVVTLVDSFANFNTWQALIKYGTEALAADRPDRVRQIIKLAFVIDAATAVLGMLAVVVLAFGLPSAFDWTAEESLLCAFYGITVLTHLAGAPDGIFRIFDAYRAQALSGIIGSVGMTAIVAVAVALDASFAGCVVALVIGEALSNILLIVVAVVVARDRGYHGWLTSSLRGWRTMFPSIAHFLMSTNAQLTVKRISTELDMVVTAALLGKVASGLLRVVKQLSTIPGRVFMPFEQVIFTELARSAAAGDYPGFMRLLRRAVGIVCVGSLAIWAVAVPTARLMITIVAGDEFVAAVPALRWYLLAMSFHVASAPVLRAVIALGRPGTLFLFELVTLVLFAGAAVAGGTWWGLAGVAIAVTLHRGVQFFWSLWLVRQIVRERSQSQNLPSPASTPVVGL